MNVYTHIPDCELSRGIGSDNSHSLCSSVIGLISVCLSSRQFCAFKFASPRRRIQSRLPHVFAAPCPLAVDRCDTDMAGAPSSQMTDAGNAPWHRLDKCLSGYYRGHTIRTSHDVGMEEKTWATHTERALLLIDGNLVSLPQVYSRSRWLSLFDFRMSSPRHTHAPHLPPTECRSVLTNWQAHHVEMLPSRRSLLCEVWYYDEPGRFFERTSKNTRPK